MSDPLSVFNAAVAAVNRGDWEEAASLCDPGSLSFFKRELLERVNAKQEPWTVEGMLNFQPDMPPAVAEYQVAQFNARSGSRRVLESEVPSVTSADQLREMSPVEVFAAWLEGQSYERQVERAIRETDVPPEFMQAALDIRPERMLVVLGTVPEGDRIIHVVYRQTYTMPDDAEARDDVPQQQVDVTPEESGFLTDNPQAPLEFATLRRQADGSWRLTADHSFLGLENASFAIGIDPGFGGDADESEQG